MTTDSVTQEQIEPERYELREQPPYHFDFTRRTFMQVLGGGILISSTGPVTLGQRSRRRGQRSIPVSARLHIGEDGTITVLTGKVEVGQGSRTQLTQAAAEELHVPVNKIKLIMADSAVVPNDGGTAGSRTTPSTVPAVRQGAATARRLLVDLACKRWKIDPDTVHVQDGTITNLTTHQSLTYAELAQTKDITEAFKNNIPRDVEVTAVNNWQVLGTSSPRAKGEDIVTGTHQYPSDIIRSHMLYGKVLRPPSYHATLTAIDLSVTQTLSDVVVIRDGDFVGCAAPTTFQAEKAIDVLAKTASWKTQTHPSSKNLFAYFKEHAEERNTDEEGSVEKGFAQADKILQRTYHIPYIQHVPMEPRAAVAEWNNGRLTVWTGTQQPSRVRGQLADAFKIAEENVRLIVPDTGGGFGGKHTGEAAIEAARLSKEAKRPVSLRWTRREEFTWAYFRPAGVIEAKAGIDKNAAITAWQFSNINSGGSAIEPPYEIPNTQTQFLTAKAPLRQGSYRALASTANNFAREAFLDELAAAAGTEPLAFRLAHLQNDRLRAVLEAAARKFNWNQRQKNKNPDIGIGLSCGTEKGSYVAACVELTIDHQQHTFKVNHICQAFECGAIMNPDNLRSQVQGCIIMGLGGALTEEIHFENGKILNASLAQYQVPRFQDVPFMDIVLLDRKDLPSVGSGETPIIAIAPAIANAVFQATGNPVDALPIRLLTVQPA